MYIYCLKIKLTIQTYKTTRFALFRDHQLPSAVEKYNRIDADWESIRRRDIAYRSTLIVWISAEFPRTVLAGGQSISERYPCVHVVCIFKERKDVSLTTKEKKKEKKREREREKCRNLVDLKENENFQNQISYDGFSKFPAARRAYSRTAWRRATRRTFQGERDSSFEKKTSASKVEALFLFFFFSFPLFLVHIPRAVGAHVSTHRADTREILDETENLRSSDTILFVKINFDPWYTIERN